MPIFYVVDGFSPSFFAPANNSGGINLFLSSPIYNRSYNTQLVTNIIGKATIVAVILLAVDLYFDAIFVLSEPGFAPAAEEILETISAFISLKGNWGFDVPLCDDVVGLGFVDGGGEALLAFM